MSTEVSRVSRVSDGVAAADVLSVVLHRDEPNRYGSRHLLHGVSRVELGRGSGLDRGLHVRLGIDHPKVSTRHAQLDRTPGGWTLTDLGSRNGSALNGARLEPNRPYSLRSGDVFELGRTFLHIALDQPAEQVPLDRSGGEAIGYGEWRTFHLPLEQVYQQLLKIAPAHHIRVLILGPTGTGKERLARGIHQLSGRQGAFVPVNCPEMHAELMDDQLFGHVRGGHSTAHSNEDGLIVRSSKGTLFLDEVADLPARAQQKLLRVFQENKVTPVGARSTADVDLRILAATSQPLASLRLDFIGRLQDFEVRLLPVAERRCDLGLMIAEILRGRHLDFESNAAWALFQHDWLFGVRGLEKLLNGLVVLAAGKRVGLRDLRKLGFPIPTMPTEPEAAERFTRAKIEDALAAAGGNVTRAAAHLGCVRETLYAQMRKFNITPPRQR